MTTPKILALLLAAAVTSRLASADELYDMPLDQLMDIPVSIATQSEMSRREAPGIVTVIEREQIQAWGARHLRDVLEMVPGFQFAGDWFHTLAPGFRGLLGLEGKILLMVDGLDMTELFYDDLIIHDQVDIDQVERIEIIRGPGSVIYGGSAEYAVINVVTTNSSHLSGSRTVVRGGTTAETWSRWGLSQAFAKRLTNDWDLAAKVSLSDQKPSDREMKYPGEENVDLGKTAHFRNYSANLSAARKGLLLRLLIDNTESLNKEYGPGVPLRTQTNIDYHYLIGQAKYDWAISERLTLSPEYRFKQTRSYYYDESSDPLYTDGTPATDRIGGYIVTRNSFSLPARIDVSENFDLLVGVQSWQDIGRSKVYLYAPSANERAKTVRYDYHAAFAQGSYRTGLGAFTAGARYEDSDRYASSFVPRMSWTKVFGATHAKLLYSQAYRSPSIGNSSDSHLYGGGAASEIKPERTSVIELEGGYRLTENQSLTANVFDIRVRDPIVYDGTNYVFRNDDETGSRGLELEYNLLVNRHRFLATYSYYSAAGYGKPDTYEVERHDDELRAFSPHKLTLSARLAAGANWTVTPRLIYIGHRHGLDDADNDGDLEVARFNPVYLFNLFVTRKDLGGLEGLDLGAGVFDLFQSNREFPAAYNHESEPLPGMSREYLVKLTYTRPF